VRKKPEHKPYYASWTIKAERTLRLMWKGHTMTEIHKGAQAASTASPPQRCSVAPTKASSVAKPGSLAGAEPIISSKNNQSGKYPSDYESRYWVWRDSIPALDHRASSLMSCWSD